MGLGNYCQASMGYSRVGSKVNPITLRGAPWDPEDIGQKGCLVGTFEGDVGEVHSYKS